MFLKRARRQQQEEEQQGEESSLLDDEVVQVDQEVAPPNSPSCAHSEGEDGETRDTDSNCGSIGNMSIQSGHGLSLEEWVHGEEMTEAADFLDDRCDTSSDGRLDGWDFNSDLSVSSDSSDSSDSSGSEGDDAHTSRDKGVSKSAGSPEPGDQGGVDQPAAAATGAVDQPGAAAATPITTEPSGNQRRSGRQNRFGGAYCAPRRRWGSKANHKAGPGQIAKVVLPEEAGDSFAALKSKSSKGKRAERRARLPQEGKLRATVKQARGRRTRKHYTRRKAQLMETYRKAYTKLQEVRNAIVS